MKRTITIDLDQQTFVGGCKGIITAVLILLYVTGRNIHRTVTRYPWAVIVVITAAYSLLTLLLYVNCTSRQRAADEDEGSVGKNGEYY